VAWWCNGFGIWGLLVQYKPLNHRLQPSACCSHTLPLSPNSIIWYQHKLETKQGHHATHWPHIDGLAAFAGAWVRATESEISVTLRAKWLRKDFTF